MGGSSSSSSSSRSSSSSSSSSSGGHRRRAARASLEDSSASPHRRRAARASLEDSSASPLRQDWRAIGPPKLLSGCFRRSLGQILQEGCAHVHGAMGHSFWSATQRAAEATVASLYDFRSGMVVFSGTYVVGQVSQQDPAAQQSDLTMWALLQRRGSLIPA